MTNLKKQIAVGVTALSLAIPGGFAITSAANAHPTTPVVALTESQATTLAGMAVDEKLALDVYTALGDVYPEVAMFDKIAASEANHLAMVRRELTEYDVTDPTLGDAAGVFDDAAVQQLYTDLVASGSASVEAAAVVGIDVETLDIAALDAALADAPPADLVSHYTRLKERSTAHLAAFTALQADPTATFTETDPGHGAGMVDGDNQGAGQGAGQGKGHGKAGKGHGKAGKAGKGKAAGQAQGQRAGQGQGLGQGQRGRH